MTTTTPAPTDIHSYMETDSIDNAAYWEHADGCYASAEFVAMLDAPVDDELPCVERLALATPVRLHNGVCGVISSHSSCESQRYWVTYFDRHFWRVCHVWQNRAQFEVVGAPQMLPLQAQEGVK